MVVQLPSALATERADRKGQDCGAFPLPEEGTLLTVKPGGPVGAARSRPTPRLSQHSAELPPRWL